MALWAFHNNPGIGGFGESTPILFDRTKINVKKRHRPLEKKKRKTEPRQASNRENIDPNSVRYSYDEPSGKGETVCAASRNDHTVGEADLVCQIVKELVDNAVDACRSPTSENDNREDRRENHEKRIRVDLRPFGILEDSDDGSIASSRSHADDILQLTVTDTGCGIENIQNCVNAFQTSKGGDTINGNETTNDVSSGRYGIGLTLCLLHAQRCVPNSRACISSATPKSKHVTRVFFEVNKREDSVKCVQEEIINVPSSQHESGTCVSLLIPGGVAAKLAWPRLFDYITRFKLCTKLHFQLDVFAPTLSKLPIFIRPRNADKIEFEGPLLERRESTTRLSQDCADGDQWKHPLDSEGSDDGNDSNSKETLANEKEKSVDCSDRNDLYEFADAVRSFLPKCNVPYENVARSVHNLRNFNDETETQRKSMVQLEVSMAVCPDEDLDQRSNSSIDSSEKATTLQLVRIVNDVPIIENAEAHACGLVHGVANKRVWGAFGIDIEKTTTTASNTSLPTPSFLLRDSSLVAPFINRNANHQQLETEVCETDHDENCKSNRKRRKGAQNYLRPVNVRIGKILVVVHVRANPSSLPLPTLSKGRLPLHHQPIDEALELGLKDCIVSLQSTNPDLFLTTLQLRMVERDALYVPAMASAVSRIVCKSRNRLLQTKSLSLIPKELEQKDSKKSALTIALERKLRLAIKARHDKSKERHKRHKSGSLADDELDDLESVGREESLRASGETHSLSQSEALGSSSSLPSFQEHSACRDDEYSSKASGFPMTEIVIENFATTTSDEEDTFEDCL